MKRRLGLDDILGRAGRNGLYRMVGRVPAGTSCIRVAGASMTGKSAMLAAMAEALAFPDYFGFNWDALEECLTDLSWLEGGVALAIDQASVPERAAAEDWKILLDILADAASFWTEHGRPFAVLLIDSSLSYPKVAA